MKSCNWMIVLEVQTWCTQTVPCKFIIDTTLSIWKRQLLIKNHERVPTHMFLQVWNNLSMQKMSNIGHYISDLQYRWTKYAKNKEIFLRHILKLPAPRKSWYFQTYRKCFHTLLFMICKINHKKYLESKHALKCDKGIRISEIKLLTISFLYSYANTVIDW